MQDGRKRLYWDYTSQNVVAVWMGPEIERSALIADCTWCPSQPSFRPVSTDENITSNKNFLFLFDAEMPFISIRRPTAEGAMTEHWKQRATRREKLEPFVHMMRVASHVA